MKTKFYHPDVFSGQLANNPEVRGSPAGRRLRLEAPNELDAIAIFRNTQTSGQDNSLRIAKQTPRWQGARGPMLGESKQMGLQAEEQFTISRQPLEPSPDGEFPRIRHIAAAAHLLRFYLL
jgi:hypothetical protein